MKLRKSMLFALIAVASTSLTACRSKSKSDVLFWSSFGSRYRLILDDITADMSGELGINIEHISKGSYDGILTEMQNALGTQKFPGIAVGYPDHFAYYHGSDILRPLDSYASSLLSDYDPDYLPENYLHERDGSSHLYGVPFNKSTELLGYNGVFVDYCVFKTGDESLRVLPETWEEWANIEDPNSKVSKYMSVFNELISTKAVIYATQDTKGKASDFSTTQGAGQVKVFDYTKADPNQTRLLTWDATDNAFITLVRQWGGKYTELPTDQYSVNPLRRRGKVLFASETNLPKTIAMLKVMNKMARSRVFGVPENVGGTFSSDAFSEGRVMFMVCSSGGLSYNTSNWENRFSVAPIPYHDASLKYVISQGANLCMTTNGDADKNFEVIKALTTGKYQTQWAIETGYFPASNSAADTPEYQAFLNGTSYDNKTIVTYREGAKVNENEYRGKAHAGEVGYKPWVRFVDDAFIGSSVVRTVVKDVLPFVIKYCVENIDDDAGYIAQIKKIIQDERISNNINISVDTNLN